MFILPRALISGIFSAVRHINLVIWLWLINLAFAAILSVPFWAQIDSTFAHASTSKNLLNRYDHESVSDFFTLRDRELEVAFQSLRSGALAYWLLGIVVVGGILAVLVAPRREKNLATFASGAGRHAPAFIRVECCFVIALLLFWLINRGLGWLLAFWFEKAQGYSTSSTLLSWAVFGKTAVSLIVIGILLQAASFAKIQAVERHDKRMVRGFFQGLGMVLQNPLTTNIFLGAMLGGAALVLWGYSQIRVGVQDPSNPWPSIGLGLGCLLVLQAILVTKFAGQLFLYRRLCPAAKESRAKEPTRIVEDEDNDLAFAPNGVME